MVQNLQIFKCQLATKWTRLRSLPAAFSKKFRPARLRPDLRSSKVRSPLNLLYQITRELTFENFSQTNASARLGPDISKVSLVLNSLQESTVELTFENFYKTNASGRVGATCDAAYPKHSDKWKCLFGEFRCAK